MSYIISGVLSADRTLTVSPCTPSQGEGIHRLEITLPDLALERIRVEFEHPTGLNRRNRTTTAYLVPTEGVLSADLPSAVLSREGKVYVQVSARLADRTWKSLFGGKASFVVTPAIAAELQVEPSAPYDFFAKQEIFLDRAQVALDGLDGIIGEKLDGLDQTAANRLTELDGKAEQRLTEFDAAAHGKLTQWNGEATAYGARMEELLAGVDAQPTENSTRPVSSGGVFAAMASSGGAAEFDYTFTVTGAADTFYPVVIDVNDRSLTGVNLITLYRLITDRVPRNWEGIPGSGNACLYRYEMRTMSAEYQTLADDNGFGYIKTLNTYSYPAPTVAHADHLQSGGYGIVLYLRGGSAVYRIRSNAKLTYNIYYQRFSGGDRFFDPIQNTQENLQNCNGGHLYAGSGNLETSTVRAGELTVGGMPAVVPPKANASNHPVGTLMFYPTGETAGGSRLTVAGLNGTWYVCTDSQLREGVHRALILRVL